jgi:hypothetical protein
MHGQAVLVAVAVGIDRRVGALLGDERVVLRDRAVGVEVQDFAIDRAQVLRGLAERAASGDEQRAVFCERQARAERGGGAALQQRLHPGELAYLDHPEQQRQLAE